jgi:hypothetical protein
LRALPLLLAVCLGACAAPRPGAEVSAAPQASGAQRAAATQAAGAQPQAPAASGSPALSPDSVELRPGTGPLGMHAIAGMLREVSAMSQAAANQRQQQLQALGPRRRPEQRLELAYLLIARAAPTSEEALQAHELLEGLDFQTEDRASRQFIRVLQRLSRQTVELAQARADLTKANHKVADLEDKIGQIKNLEVQLQNRSQERAPKPAPPKGAVR